MNYNGAFSPLQVRDAPIQHMTLLAHSDTEAEAHARLLSWRPNLRAESLRRWVEWEGRNQYPDMPLRLLRAGRLSHVADVLIDSLTTARLTTLASSC